MVFKGRTYSDLLGLWSAAGEKPSCRGEDELLFIPRPSSVHGGCQCSGIVPSATAPAPRNEVIIHGPIFAWGVGHRLSNPLKIRPELKRLGKKSHQVGDWQPPIAERSAVNGAGGLWRRHSCRRVLATFQSPVPACGKPRISLTMLPDACLSLG